MNLRERIEILEKKQGHGFEKLASKIIQGTPVTDTGLSVFGETWERCPGESDANLKQRATGEILRLPGHALMRKVMLEYARAMWAAQFGRLEGESEEAFLDRVGKFEERAFNSEREMTNES